MMASPWAGLVRATPRPAPVARRSRVARNPLPGRIKKLESLLERRGPMNSDELQKALGWTRAALAATCCESARVYNLGNVRVPATVPYLKATIRIVDGVARPGGARLRTAKLIYDALHAGGALSFSDLDQALGKNRNTIRNTIYKHPEVFEVVQSMDERPGHVIRARYGLRQS